MKYLSFLLLFAINLSFSQTTTKTVTLSNGDGWYRIIEGVGHKTGLIRVTGALGNNKLTDISMYISIMSYDQGGSINIINNKFYNGNHIDEIRAGTSNGKYVLDLHFVSINTPVNINITSDSGITPLNTPVFNPSPNFTGKIEISGRIIGTSSTRWPIYFSDNVGIGTTTPDSKLTVKGNIHTNEVKVDLLGAVAPDYVFYKDYDLKSLKEVEDYIAAEGHLPKIPSAKEMEKEGIKLKEMNLKLLEKIEELTLYTIDQEKKLETQKNTIQNLETRLQKIEALLNSKK
ncbi:tail fiber protein [Flavivirga eckloniae]|uniref:Cell wall anchor protein n=1 Tax=Flavivirga eckloniae TaxID=1803846 RepID=A0A2K9PT05_9FLAO|nr:tail fiber protein [Flavivirga eckloniae]AUP79677.1 hypothetical protein C1H87_13555 [Flavivirga eckloniae]